jgi:hypothetical protein
MPPLQLPDNRSFAFPPFIFRKDFYLDFIDLDSLSQERNLEQLSVLCEFIVGAAG